MNFKSIVIFILVLALVLGEGYLIVSVVMAKINTEKDVENFCTQKCNYSQDSFLWEFSGEYSNKGFTTENECFNYCSKVRQGFAYFLTEYAPAYFINLFK
jgi:hypothetical protein